MIITGYMVSFLYKVLERPKDHQVARADEGIKITTGNQSLLVIQLGSGGSSLVPVTRVAYQEGAEIQCSFFKGIRIPLKPGQGGLMKPRASEEGDLPGAVETDKVGDQGFHTLIRIKLDTRMSGYLIGQGYIGQGIEALVKVFKFLGGFSVSNSGTPTDESVQIFFICQSIHGVP
jgi:hypothetical protein